MRTFFRQWLQAWERVEISEGPYHRAHGNQVLSFWSISMLGRDSGLEFGMDTAVVWTFLDERIVHVALFGSGEEALRAVGLEA